MCLILVAWRVHPRFPCVVAANRDELHARPAAPAAWWPDTPHILAGRDLDAGGTWLGMTRSGRFAALTNHRNPAAEPARSADPPSRGSLVTRLLDSALPVAGGIDHLRGAGGAYRGFNLIFSDGVDLGIYESVPGAGRALAPGIYGLSNHLLDTPWPKVRHAKSRLLAALAGPADDESLIAMLRDDQPAPDQELPDSGLERDWERLLSSAFVLSPDYGTRCSTVLRIDADRRASFDEWTWDPAGNEVGRASHRFDLGPA